MELTKSEMEIMDVLWESDKPMSRADLLARSEEKTWKDSSVHILLNGLLQKGAIQEAGLVKRSKTYGRIFSPTMTREEYFHGRAGQNYRTDSAKKRMIFSRGCQMQLRFLSSFRRK